MCWRLIFRPSVCDWRSGCSTACVRVNRWVRCSLPLRTAIAGREVGPVRPYFREVAPLVAKKLAQTTDQAVEPVGPEAIAANNVVDGLVLHRKWKSLLDMMRVSFLPHVCLRPAARIVQQAHEKARADTAPTNGVAGGVGICSTMRSMPSATRVGRKRHQAVQGNPLRTAARSTRSRVAKCRRQNSKSCARPAPARRCASAGRFVRRPLLACPPVGRNPPCHYGRTPSLT